ncbi:DinB family protein [Marivirga sp. S37H4]|uniref:DinB family protein n=1 Tax=Marivirga aurantiaca TaxID=2802615 RepID=A0A934X0T5_9BACT|nr:DinB family protein [Marivirga aurantiaca]MBK6266377.1 DinB family protein [Marivirga aurantiaca]
MHPKIEKHWQRIKVSKEYYDALLKVFNPTQLNFRPEPSAWSMMDVMQHLYTSEKLSSDFVKNFDFSRKDLKLGLKSRIKTILLVNRLNSRKKFKAPKVLEQNKGRMNLSPDAHEFGHQWAGLRSEMKLMLENFPEEKLNHFTFNHPAVGKMTITQTLEFFYSHMNHHKYQIEAINHHPNFPL